MLATDNWCIKVDERIYGPYTHEQMSSFAKEGRLSATSQVAPAGGKIWRDARQFPPLAQLFGSSSPGQNQKAFGRAKTETESHVLPDGALANFLLIFDETLGTAGRLETQIRLLGEGFRLTSNVWCVSSNLSTTSIRNALQPHMQTRDSVFIVDASRGRTAFHNLLPDIHARVTKALVRSIAA